MKRRLTDFTGLGGGQRDLLDNQGELPEEFGQDVIEAYFSKEHACDYQIKKTHISVGIEPTYQYDRLKIITIHSDKFKSNIRTGRAWGPYGTQIAVNKRIYSEYKTKSKFVKFVDKWHPVLFPDGVVTQ